MDAQHDRRVFLAPVDFDHAEVMIHAGFTVAILVGFHDIPFLIDAARGQIVEWVAILWTQNRKLAPMDITRDEHDAVRFAVLDQIDHANPCIPTPAHA